jgi:hypothetical protein
VKASEPVAAGAAGGDDAPVGFGDPDDSGAFDPPGAVAGGRVDVGEDDTVVGVGVGGAVVGVDGAVVGVVVGGVVAVRRTTAKPATPLPVTWPGEESLRNVYSGAPS